MTQTVELPLWVFLLIVAFATITALSHFLLPSVRWFFRRRLERAVAELNKRLARPIQPFKLARRHDMIQRLIYDPAVTQEIVNHARKSNVPENVAFQRARRYAREIVPSFSAFAYFSFGISLARFLAKTLYDVRIGKDNIEHLHSVPKDATIVFVMNHRSNMDYVLVTYLAAREAALSYAVGEWARVWPLSSLIKSMGAYFIRRQSRGALYRKVLQRYVVMATQGGVNQAIFPEGGLSVTGQVMPSKVGLLSYVIEAQQSGDRAVYFMPVAINYDRVLEDRVLVAAGQSGTRRFNARISVVLQFVLRKIWLRLRGRFVRFGTAAVVFGDPVPLADYGDQPDPEKLANDLSARIEANMPVLFVPLLAHILLNATEPLSEASLLKGLEQAILQINGPILTDPEELTTSMRRACDHMAQRSMIKAVNAGWRIVTYNRKLLEFYANSIAHYFVDDAGAA